MNYDFDREIDFADFERKLRGQNVKLFILCSPHNPVCRVWTREELRRLGELCGRYGVYVVSDEIHCDFAFPEHPHTIFPQACPELAERTVVCTAPSKTFNLAGRGRQHQLFPVISLLLAGKRVRRRREGGITVRRAGKHGRAHGDGVLPLRSRPVKPEAETALRVLTFIRRKICSTICALRFNQRFPKRLAAQAANRPRAHEPCLYRVKFPREV